MNNWGIDINITINGVWLPKDIHARLPGSTSTAHREEGVYGEAYKQPVWTTLKGAQSKPVFETGLIKLKRELESGKTFPLSRQGKPAP